MSPRWIDNWPLADRSHLTKSPSQSLTFYVYGKGGGEIFMANLPNEFGAFNSSYLIHYFPLMVFDFLWKWQTSEYGYVFPRFSSFPAAASCLYWRIDECTKLAGSLYFWNRNLSSLIFIWAWLHDKLCYFDFQCMFNEWKIINSHENFEKKDPLKGIIPFC